IGCSSHNSKSYPWPVTEERITLSRHPCGMADSLSHANKQQLGSWARWMTASLRPA
ncbi:mCG1043308, partial [Mus musculus]